MTDGVSGSVVQQDSVEDWLLDEDERSRMLWKGDYRDTELEVKVVAPDVRADEYYERVEVTKIDPEDNGRYGWTKLSLPADSADVDEFISALIHASNRLVELERNSK